MNKYFGWLAAIGIAFILGWTAHWGFHRKKAPIGTVSDTTHSQPVFVHDTVFQYRKTTIKAPVQPSFAIDTLSRTPNISPLGDDKSRKSDTVQAPCSPFSLHLSSQLVPDSIVLDYLYPQGLAGWMWWGAEQSSPKRPSYSSDVENGLLRWGIQSTYLTYQSKLRVGVFLRANLRRVYIQGGYEIVGNSHPSYFLTIGKSYGIF